MDEREGKQEARKPGRDRRSGITFMDRRARVKNATSAVDWPAAAVVLAGAIPHARLDPGVLAWAEAAPRRGRWAVAFSGGADSLALLLLIWAHWPERRRTLRVLHYDHRLRGAESRGDAAFCRKVCAKLGVKLIEGRWTRAPRDASEAEARAARLAFFAAKARVLWLGQHQDDVAETMLMRLARGSGAGGLAAPRPVQRMPGARVHLRPLLTIKKAEIVGALRTAGATWREDSSNEGGRFFRNRVRRDVVPVWSAAAQRDAVAGAARSRGLLEEDDAALEAWLESLDMFSRRGELDLRPLVGKPRGLIRRALHRWLLAQPKVGEISRQAFDALLVSLEGARRTRHSMGRQGFAVTDGKVLRFEKTGKVRHTFQRRTN